jgi:parallel beta-helix repeat protein
MRALAAESRKSWVVRLVAIVSATLVLSARTLADVVPTDGMVIAANTTFVPGTYYLPSGVSIGASGITLDMNGATLVGTQFNNYGVTCIGRNNVTIRNGAVHGYYYGMRIENGAGVQIINNDLSGNWLDPASLQAPPPFLNINVGPNLGDRTNLGGGLFMNDVSGATVSGNTASNQENGLDLFYVTGSTISGNDASDNTGWGIHLYAATDNTVSGNVADRCIRTYLYDSAGFLVVYGSSRNQFLNNSFQGGGDGFFLGNEWGCPSNDNLIQGNDGSYAGANAFEATFSSGNQFIDNIASGSNYGFWLGYSHDGNVIRGNSIQANNANGIEIEHGQNNVIEGNIITGNGGRAIVLRTDGQVHFPPASFPPCMNMPNQAWSRFYTIKDNIIHSNYGGGIQMTSTTDSTICNNLIANNIGGTTATSNGANNVWSVTPTPGTNIIGGPYLGGNYWSNYTGLDTSGDGLGDTALPYTNGGQIAAPGDPHPLVGDVELPGFGNPETLCNRAWTDLGPNTHSSGSQFGTANGAHFATDGTNLYLLESNNGSAFDQFNPVTSRYEPRAALPEGVQDGGDLEGGDGVYYAGPGLQFDTSTGDGKASRLYAYDPGSDSWSSAARCLINGHYYGHEALAFDPAGHRLYATIIFYQTGGDPSSTSKLAVYNPSSDAWVGLTASAPDSWGGGSEAQCLGGKVYVWRGGWGGAGVNGSDSYLDVYDIATGTWGRSPSLLASGVIPGWRSGGFDVWGVSLAADEAHGRVFVLGGESNRLLYVFDVASQSWAVGPTAVYDGGWGSSLEYVASSQLLYEIDGRNASGTTQGTAVMSIVPMRGDMNCDCRVDFDDINPFVAALVDQVAYGARYPDCRWLNGDIDGNQAVDFDDINPFVNCLVNSGCP